MIIEEQFGTEFLWVAVLSDHAEWTNYSILSFALLSQPNSNCPMAIIPFGIQMQSYSSSSIDSGLTDVGHQR